jgi:transcriptional pleiotropic regulator of transition state genes
MKSTGVVRKLDDLGRLCIPKEIRNILGIKPQDPIEIFVQGETIVLKKYSLSCTLCGNLSLELVSFYPDKSICRPCVNMIVKEHPRLVFSLTGEGDAPHA